LRAIGRAIASLTILDSEVPDEDQAPVREYCRIEAIMKMIEVFEQIAECSLEISSDELESCDDAAQRALLHKRLVRVGLMPERSNPDVLRGLIRAFTANLRTHYTPDQVYPEPMRLVLVDDPKLDDETNRKQHERSIEGWKRRAPNLFFLHGLGNHMTTLKLPYVKTLATWLNLDLQSNGGELRITETAKLKQTQRRS